MSFRLKTILGIALIEITLLPILIIMSINYLENSNEEHLPLKFANDQPNSLQHINYSGPVVVNLTNPMLQAAMVELCKLWGLHTYGGQSSPKLLNPAANPPLC